MDAKGLHRFSHFSCRTQQVVTSSTWEGLLIEQSTLSADTKGSERDTWWVDICDATEEETTFKSSRSLKPSSSIPGSAGFYILVFKNATVTFSPSGCHHIARVRDRIRRTQDTHLVSSDWICYALIDEIIDDFEPYMRAAEREADAIEDQVFIARVDDVKALIPQLDSLRKSITQLIRCLTGKYDVLSGFVKRCQAKDRNPMFPDGDLLVYLGDVQDHLVTTLTSLSHFDEIVGRSQSNFLAQLSVNNIRLSYDVNAVLSKVTILATIFVPLHMVTGLFGMNVEVPGQNVDNLGWFFGIIGWAAIDEESLWEMNAGGGGLAIGEALEWRSGAPAKLGVGKLSRETARKRGRDVMVIH
ncbi:hypothetical protein BDQ94DRAFT_170658 [Aspergillus welwitschiae]|uniref:Uncharacterized protein n=1 Tax=Aspergillus welwitschiae TaxID=1341132 RepID=A0A3F3Q167_9EURO|nr:hypothetical protein BDQ94DRAFT_170658 [Aspergillus welwitschiae]RDH32964.1 hypothetical protein BDQ94DRAFT_170658 [Aspergillus welwitschiae]